MLSSAVYIIVGVAIFLAPFILFHFLLLHPSYDKKTQEHSLVPLTENPTPYISSMTVIDNSLRLVVNKATSFKAILFNAKGRPCKVLNVTCKDPSKPCIYSGLPKWASGIAFVERDPNKRLSFDMQLWKIFVLPLGYTAGTIFGALYLILGIWVKRVYEGTNLTFLFPNRMSVWFMLMAAGVIYLIAFLCLFCHYAHINKKEGE